MKRLLTLSYIGTAYHGWQVQQNARSVQQTVQDAIEQITGKRRDLTGCSRTDAGVHALTFCCTFDLEKPMDDNTLRRALNAVLPLDIAVKQVQTVPEDFHPRYTATGKSYIYRILNAPYRNPFEEGRVLYCSRPLQTDRMQQAADALVGTHDFAAFMSAGSSVTDTVRTVTACTVCRDGDIVTVRIAADGFLYNMVRIIVGTLLAVSDGDVNLADMPGIITSKNRSLAGPTAPPEGLYLEQVFYPAEAFAQPVRPKEEVGI